MVKYGFLESTYKQQKLIVLHKVAYPLSMQTAISLIVFCLHNNDIQINLYN